MRNYFITVIVLFFYSSYSYSQSTQDSSKHQYNLFHPTPKSLMRDFSPDRPDATESPYTVDAGHFQFETDLFKREQSKISGIKDINTSFNDANLKFGITNNLDLQLVVGTYSTTKIKNGNNISRGSGFGGLTLRAKRNLWGNDKGKTAFGILPFINIPTNSSEKISGGIVFPLAILFSNGWDFATQIETDFEKNQSGERYHLNYIVSASTSHSLLKNLDFFIEGVVIRENETTAYEYFFNGGFVFSANKNLKIDDGFYYGLKSISSKTFFVGLSIRI
jgi:hypothetical protein